MLFQMVPRVDVLGRVEEAKKAELLASAWVVLSAAHHEGWGMSVLEGAAFGTPTVGRRRPGIRDAVVDGVTGCLVAPKDEGELPRALGRAMVELVRNTAHRDELGTAARRRAADLSWSHSVDRWERLLWEPTSQRKRCDPIQRKAAH